MRRYLLVLAIAACNDDGSSEPPSDGPGSDMAPGDGGLATTCTGACAITTLTATFGATTRVLDVAYFGITTEGSVQTLYVEAYRGASAGCPTQSSPTPDYTLILGRIPMPTSTTVVSSPGNLIDFEGDLLPSPAPAAASAVMLTPVALNAMQAAFEAQLTFPTGTITGHLFATHCDSLDDPQ